MSDLFNIEGKAALVTGGSRGIGLMIARGFVEAGARVYVSSRKKDVCDEVAAELSKVGTCVSLPADLATEDACIALAAEVSRAGARAAHPREQRGRDMGCADRRVPGDARGTRCSTST